MSSYEAYPYDKFGLAYERLTGKTIFLEDNCIHCTNDAEFAAALATARSDSSINCITLDPAYAEYFYPLNACQNIFRYVDDPLVIRTLPGSGSKAKVNNIYEFKGFPGAIAFVDLQLTGVGARILGGDGKTNENVLFESCTGYIEVQGASSGGVPTDRFYNAQVRLCTAYGLYRTANLQHGFYCDTLEGLLIEGCVFDHNGWDPAVTRADHSDHGGNVRTHNMYLNRPGLDYHVRHCVISRGSSHGCHAKAGAKIYDCIFVNNPIHTQQGYGRDGDLEDYGVVGFGRTHRCVFIGSDYVTATDVDRTVVAWIACIVNCYMEDNLVYDNINLYNSATGTQNAFVWFDRFNGQIQLTSARNKTVNWLTNIADAYYYGAGTAPVSLNDDLTNDFETTVSAAGQAMVDEMRDPTWVLAMVTADQGADLYDVASRIEFLKQETN